MESEDTTFDTREESGRFLCRNVKTNISVTLIQKDLQERAKPESSSKRANLAKVFGEKWHESSAHKKPLLPSPFGVSAPQF